jgi:nitrogen fixation protein NifU and related proteins
MNSLYSKKVLAHFKHPKNMGEMKNPDAVGEVGNLACGDVMRVYIKVKEKENKKYIKDIKFQTMGCIAAIATSSMVTEIAKGKTLEEAKKITNKDVAQDLGGLPPIKMHCSNLAANALHKAIEEYEKKQVN